MKCASFQSIGLLTCVVLCGCGGSDVPDESAASSLPGTVEADQQSPTTPPDRTTASDTDPQPVAKPKRKRPQLPAEAWEKPDNLPSDLWAVYDSWSDGEPTTFAIGLDGTRKELVNASAGEVLKFKFLVANDSYRKTCTTFDGASPFAATEDSFLIAPDASARLIMTETGPIIERAGPEPASIKVSNASDKFKPIAVAWSPDGKTLLVTVRESVDMDDGRVGSVHHLRWVHIKGDTAEVEPFREKALSAAWHSSGEKFVFTDQSDNLNWTICVCDADGSNVEKICPGGGAEWAGDWLVYCHYDREGKSQNIMRANSDGTHVVNNAPGSWNEFTISPDGQFVAITGFPRNAERLDGYARTEVLVANVDTGEVTSLENIPGLPGGEPLWSPDQKFLLLRNTYNKLPALMCIPLDRSAKAFVLADDANQVAGWIRQ